MKLALIGTGNMPLMQWILDGKGDDAIINMSALPRRLGCSRSSLLDRIQAYGFDYAIKHYLNLQRQRKLKTLEPELTRLFIFYLERQMSRKNLSPSGFQFVFLSL